MNRLIVGLPLILSIVSDSAAAPTLSSLTIRSPLTRLPADNDGAVLLSLLFSNLTASRQYARNFSNSMDELQPIPNAFFPTYGIVLLVLFIVICVLSGVLVMIVMHSRTTWEWIRIIPRHVYDRFTQRHQGSMVQKEAQRPERGSRREKNPCDSPTKFSPMNRDLNSYNISSGPKNKPHTASEETVTTIPDASSVAVHSPSASCQMRLVSRNPLSPHDPAHSHPLFSSLIDHLQTFLSASKRMFQFLSADLTSRSSTSHSPSPHIAVNVDVFVPTPTKCGNIILSPSSKTTTLDGDNVMIVDGDIRCQGLALSPPTVTAILPQNPLPQRDQFTTHGPTCSRIGFYSLSVDAQLSASTAFHSFVDLSMSATPGDTVSDIMQANSLDDEDNIASVFSPRYIHGVQLETIHEESDGHATSLALAPSVSPVRDCSPLADTPILSTSHEIPTSISGITMDTLGKARSDSTTFTTKILSSRGDLAHEPVSPPPLFPVARPPPPPSKPLSGTVQEMSAFHSPEKQDRRRSVAWLKPVIDWAVDHPRNECDCNPKAHENQDDIPNMEHDAECADALHVADAMAAVIDSLAAIGMDPTDMGLVTGEAISSTMCSFSFPSTSPSLPFVDSEAFCASLHAQAVEEDLIEEQEVEHVIGAASTVPSQRHQSGAFVCETHHTAVKPQYNRSASQDQQQGESIKTALISLLSPSPSHISPGEIQLDAQESSTLPTFPARGLMMGRKTTPRDAGQNNSENISAGIQQMHENSKSDAGWARSAATSRMVTRTPRTAQPGRVYASPSSLAGLSPLEVAKKISNTSGSSAGSTPSPSGTRVASPQYRPSSVSPLRLRRTKRVSTSPSFDCTVTMLSSSSRHDQVSPSPRSRTPVSYCQHWQQQGEDPSKLGCTKSTAMLSLQTDTGILAQFNSSPTSLLQLQKPPAVSVLARPAPILSERTNSMEFKSV